MRWHRTALRAYQRWKSSRQNAVPLCRTKSPVDPRHEHGWFQPSDRTASSVSAAGCPNNVRCQLISPGSKGSSIFSVAAAETGCRSKLPLEIATQEPADGDPGRAWQARGAPSTPGRQDERVLVTQRLAPPAFSLRGGWLEDRGRIETTQPHARSRIHPARNLRNISARFFSASTVIHGPTSKNVEAYCVL
jgi:hypothetical protein